MSYFDRRRAELRDAHRSAMDLARYIRHLHGPDSRCAALVLDVAAAHRRALADLYNSCF